MGDDEREHGPIERSRAMRRRLMSVLSVGVASCLIACGASANGPEVGFDAGSIYPLRSPDIQLVTEEVVITLPAQSAMDRGWARCVYVLRNLGQRQVTTSMAFVTNPPLDELGEERNPVWRQFRASQDGRALDVRLGARRGDGWAPYVDSWVDSLPVWSITIGPRATTKIQMDYEVQWSGGCEGDDACSRTIGYYTRPAALWAGKIEHARFLLRLGDSCVVQAMRANPGVEVTPETCKWTAEGVEWSFDDWEPSEDLRFDVESGADAGAVSDPVEAQAPGPCDPGALPPVTTSVDRTPKAERLDTCVVQFYARQREPDLMSQADLRVLVDETGRLEDLRVVRHPSAPFSDREVVATAWALRFDPARRGGVRVKAWTDVTIPVRGVIGPD